jgi:hypothetical protein
MEKEDDGSNRLLKRKQYEQKLRRLQAELCKLQDWVNHEGLRVVVVFEGHDAAGKGGTIRAITERQPEGLSPSGPSRSVGSTRVRCIYRRREKSSSSIGAGTTAAGVEYVMGFALKNSIAGFWIFVP